jgi:regulator of chromosome condensation (RCC1) repeat-containing protein
MVSLETARRLNLISRSASLGCPQGRWLFQQARFIRARSPAPGGVLCWGDNSSGELGNGTNTGSTVPVAVSGLIGGVQAISAGSEFTCAVTEAGAVECWGNNGDGNLGDGDGADTNVPMMISGFNGSTSGCLSNNSAPATDGPLPLWALGALGAGLVGIASRRLKKAAA